MGSSSKANFSVSELTKRIQELELKLENTTKGKDELFNTFRSINLITKNANAMYSINDFDIHCKFRYVSPSVKKIAGYDPEDMVGKSAFDFVHPKDKKQIILPLMKTYLEYKTKKIPKGELRDKSETFNYRYKDKSGKWRFAETTSNLVDDKLIMVTTDIGEQKEWEAKVKQSQIDFNNMLTNLNDIYFRVDTDGIVSEINPIIEKIAGFKPKEVIGKPVSFVFRNDNEFQKFIQDVNTTSSLNNYDMILLRKDGSDIHVSANVYVLRDEEGRQLGIEGILRDNTERKQTEIKLRENEQNMSFLASTAIDLPMFVSTNEIYAYVGKKLIDLIENKGFIAIVEHTDDGTWEVKSIKGLPKRIEQASKLIGVNIKNLKGTLNRSNVKYFKKGKLNLVKDDISQFTQGIVTKKLVTKVLKLMDVHDVYVIPFLKDIEMLGSITIITSSETKLLNKDLIEAFVGQVTTFLDKLKTQEELQQSEIRYKTIYESSKQAIVLLSEKGDTFIHGNNEFLKLLNIKDLSDLRLLTPANISPKYQPDGLLSINSSINHINQALMNGSDFFEWVHKRTDGEELYCTVLLTRYEIDKVKYLQAVVTDISDKKLTEQLLLESEEKFSKSFKSSPYIIGITTMEEGRYIDINDAFENITGYSREDVIGMTSTELNLWKNIKSRQILLEEVKQKGRVKDLEMELKTKSGDILTTLFSAERIMLKGEPHIIASVQDISDKKQVVDALKTSEERFRLITDLTSDLAYAFHIHKNGDVTHLWSTGPMEKITGYHTAEVTEMGGWDKIIYKDDAAIPYSQLKNLLKNKEDYVDYRVVRKNGTLIWVRDYARPIFNKDIKKVEKIYGSIKEITEQKIAELELQDSQKKYQDLYDNAPDMYFSVNPLGEILSVNEFGAKYLGYSKEELIGKPVWIVVYPDDLAMVQSQVNRIIETKKGTSNLEFRKSRKDGSILFVQERIQCITDSDGNCVELRINCRDLSENKIAQKKIIDYQQNLKSLSNALIVAEEMERKRLAIALHDTIGQLLAMSKIKLSNMSKSAKTDKCDAEIQSIKDLISDAIKESRNLTYELSPPILHELGLFAACKWYVDQIKSSGMIDIIIKGDEIRFKINEEIRILLFRAIRELLNNVYKHAKASQIILTVKRLKDTIKVTVKDDGSGFETEHLRQKSIEGKKLGLFSISERIEYLGGSFEIKSTVSKGTVVTIIVPM